MRLTLAGMVHVGVAVDGSGISDLVPCPKEACFSPVFSGDGLRLAYERHTLITGLDGKPYQLGYHGPLAPIFGSNSWEWLLLAPTMK